MVTKIFLTLKRSPKILSDKKLNIFGQMLDVKFLIFLLVRRILAFDNMHFDSVI